MASLSIVGGGMVFLLAMVFLLFPEWMRTNVFAPGSVSSVVRTMLLRPAHVPGDDQEADMAVSPRGRGFVLAGRARDLADSSVSLSRSEDALAGVGLPPADATGSQSTPTTAQGKRAAGFELDTRDQGSETPVLASVPPVPTGDTIGGPGASPVASPTNQQVAGTPSPPAVPIPGNPPPTAQPTPGYSPPGNSPPTAGPAPGHSPRSGGPAPGNSPSHPGPHSGVEEGG